MFFLKFEVTPSAGHPSKDQLGGAYVNCWIERPTLDEAIEVAHRMIRESNFVVEEPDEATEVEPADFDKDSEGFSYYQRALSTKAVVVFFQFPAKESEAS